MAETSLAILRHIRDLAGVGAVRDCDDGELVERFASRQEQAAFVTLMRRHGPMVLGVCLRVLGNRHDAEDAFQATFLVLARKAGSIRNRAYLASWLCRVAYHAAVRARGRDQARAAIERIVARPIDQAGRDTDEERVKVLDEELQRLPDKYHAPLVLCYLEGKTYEDAARQLGWPLGTIKKRLAQGRDLLRRRLTRRYLGSEAGLLPALTIAPCPARWLHVPEGVSIAVSQLAEEVIRAMFMTRLKIGIVMLALTVLAAGMTLMAGSTPSQIEDRAAAKEDSGQAAPVVKKHLRILFAGTPTREWQFTRALFEREAEKKKGELSVFVQTGGSRAVPGSLKRFPNLLRPEGFAGTKDDDKPYNLSKYDLLVAFDLDWSKLSPEVLVLLQSWVEKHGGSIIIVAGPAHTPALGKANALAQDLGPILELSPVVPADGAMKGDMDKPRRLTLAKKAADQSFLDLAGGKDPQKSWEAFYSGEGKGKELQRGFYTYQPVKSVKKGAQVLLTFADPKVKKGAPYLITWTQGKGKVVWIGSGELWRLRQYRVAYHERFWLELARYAAGRIVEDD